MLTLHPWNGVKAEKLHEKSRCPKSFKEFLISRCMRLSSPNYAIKILATEEFMEIRRRRQTVSSQSLAVAQHKQEVALTQCSPSVSMPADVWLTSRWTRGTWSSSGVSWRTLGRTARSSSPSGRRSPACRTTSGAPGAISVVFKLETYVSVKN